MGRTTRVKLFRWGLSLAAFFVLWEIVGRSRFFQ